jgi:uncharacterized protein YcaQ
MPVALTLPEARRLAIASQGFGPRPAAPSLRHVLKLAATLHAFQIDSVNVVVRAHYVPAYARLGPYPMDALDALAYRKRELLEYWGHAPACFRSPSIDSCGFAWTRSGRGSTCRPPCTPASVCRGPSTPGRS